MSRGLHSSPIISMATSSIIGKLKRRACWPAVVLSAQFCDYLMAFFSKSLWTNSPIDLIKKWFEIKNCMFKFCPENTFILVYHLIPVHVIHQECHQLIPLELFHHYNTIQLFHFWIKLYGKIHKREAWISIWTNEWVE